jgi:predicted Ser/Thr protein kinase
MPEAKKCPQCGAVLPAGALGGLCPACLLKQAATPETATQPPSPPFEPPTVEEVARWFPQLEILGFLGKGGMGAVYKARQPALDRLVALKILPPQTAGDHPAFAERFNREARALARLNHPNIVAVYEFGQVNSLPYFIMEFVDGLNLRQLERAGRLSPREALNIVPQICEALQFAHDEGVVHRDIKPENILLDKRGRVKIADFGIAKIMGQDPEPRVAETQGAIGTPHYMAPEQVEKPETVDHRADIFSLGVVFYEMLTGELPLGKFAPPSRKVEVDVRLDEVVLRALEKEPEHRYQHASQVKTAVETISGTAAPPPPIPGTFTSDILARDYVLDIGSCLSRGWALILREFWPIIGVSALVMLLIQAAYSTAIGLVVGGPLIGGLWLYYLKKIRGEQATLETAFSGFSPLFLQLFLAGLVTFFLTLAGFICLILPGIFLSVVWLFVAPLVIDKRFDFWPAMELSRKVVMKHWWKFFGFWLVLALLVIAGIMACWIGFLITAPVAFAALAYAYEDIFGVAGSRATQPSASYGPSGTVIPPAGPPPGPPPFATPPGGGSWKPAVIVLAAFILIAGLIAAGILANVVKRQHHWARLSPFTEVKCETNSAIVRFNDKDYRLVSVNDLDTARILEHCRAAYGDWWDKRFSEDLVEVLAEMGRPMARNRTVKLMLEDTATGELTNIERAQMTAANRAAVARMWDANTPGEYDRQNPVSSEDLAQRLEAAGQIGDPTQRDKALAAVATAAARSGQADDARSALAQISDPTTRDHAVADSALLLAKSSHSKEATDASISLISDPTVRDKILFQLAESEAEAGEADTATASLLGINDPTTRDAAAGDCARLLAKHGFRKPALNIAQTIITDPTARDKALSELAQ